MVPTWGLKDHVTPVFGLPLTVGVKVALWPPVSDAVPGSNVRLMAGGVAEWAAGCSVTRAVADLVESTTLVAVIVTVCELLMVAGAV